MRRAAALLLGTLATFGATATAAGADPLTITLDRAEVSLKSGTTGAESDGDSVFTGEIDTATGNLTFAEAAVELPDFAIGPFTIITDPSSQFTGNYNAVSGQLSLSGTVDVHVPVDPSNPSDRCTFPGLSLSLSTENQSPFAGSPFLTGLDGGGAIVAAWSDLPPVQGTNTFACSQVESNVDGPGGAVIETLALAATVSPTVARVKRGKSKEFGVVVTAPGTGPGGGANPETTVCATVPPDLKLVGDVCRTRTESLIFKFEVKAKRRADLGRHELGFEATAEQHMPAVVSATLKVRR